MKILRASLFFFVCALFFSVGVCFFLQVRTCRVQLKQLMFFRKANVLIAPAIAAGAGGVSSLFNLAFINLYLISLPPLSIQSS